MLETFGRSRTWSRCQYQPRERPARARPIPPRVDECRRPWWPSGCRSAELRPVERDLLNIGGAHSALMLAARITLPHFSVSLAMNFPNSLGEVGNAVAPSSAIRALILGSPSATLVSLLSL